MRYVTRARGDASRQIARKKTFLVYSDEPESRDLRHLRHLLPNVLGCDTVVTSLPYISTDALHPPVPLGVDPEGEVTVFVFGHGGFDASGYNAYVWNNQGNRVYLDSGSFAAGLRVAAVFAFICDGLQCPVERHRQLEADADAQARWESNKMEAARERETRPHATWVYPLPGSECARLQTDNPGLQCLLAGLSVSPFGNLRDLRRAISERLLTRGTCFPFVRTNRNVRGTSAAFPGNSSRRARCLAYRHDNINVLARSTKFEGDRELIGKMALALARRRRDAADPCRICDKPRCSYSPRGLHPNDCGVGFQERNVVSANLNFLEYSDGAEFQSDSDDDGGVSSSTSEGLYDTDEEREEAERSVKIVEPEKAAETQQQQQQQPAEAAAL
jgi:hypothetical protein